MKRKMKMVGYNDVGKWMENSIAIGEASVNREHGSIGEAYRFTSTTGYSMREGLENCYEAKVGGKSNISPGDLDETSRYKEKSFYQDTLKFDSSKWSFTSVGHFLRTVQYMPVCFAPCSCVCSRLISPSVSSWHKQDNTSICQSGEHIQHRTPYNS